MTRIDILSVDGKLLFSDEKSEVITGSSCSLFSYFVDNLSSWMSRIGFAFFFSSSSFDSSGVFLLNSIVVFDNRKYHFNNTKINFKFRSQKIKKKHIFSKQNQFK